MLGRLLMSRISSPLLRTTTRAKATSTTPLSYTERMDKTGRPISPHIWPAWAPGVGVPATARGFIYKLPAIAWASITMRITGVFMTVGMSGFGFMALVK